MESPIYSIIIPAYNEAQRIGATLEKIITYISQQSWHVELIVVNDGSRDNTVEVVNSYKSRAPYLRVVENPGNRGKGYSVRNGMLHASGDLLLFTDADLSAPIYEAKK
ncbi:MAG TPA: glycosyltransferase, partial [Terriglobales bacterium]